MPRNFSLDLSAFKSGAAWKDPRLAMRAVLGILLLANLVAAVFAFRPFGGGAADLRRDRDALQQQLTQLQAQVAKSKKLVDKIQIARTEGDQFLAKYFTDRRVVTSTIQGELVDIAKQAGIVFQPTTWTDEPIEGSDDLIMKTINAGCQGNYTSLAKFINLVDRSPRFLILESLVAAPQQTGQTLNVTVKIDTFVKDTAGAVGQEAGGAGPAQVPESGPGGAL
jgi:type IV pilus assembly protein PilO